MDWIRIDNRLVHGQIIETWLPHTHAGAIIIANDAVADDLIQQEIMSLAIPQSIRVAFTAVKKVSSVFETMNGSALVLFATCKDARVAHEKGFTFDILNVGNIHYEPGKRQLSPSVALSVEEENCLRSFLSEGVTLDFRCVPNDPVQVKF